MKSLSSFTLTVSLVLALLVASIGPSIADVQTTSAFSTSDSEIEKLMAKIRRLPRLPEIVVILAERAYRIYKLHKLEKKVTTIETATMKALRDLEAIASQVERQEKVQTDTMQRIAAHEQAHARLEGQLRSTRRNGEVVLDELRKVRRELAILRKLVAQRRQGCKIPEHANKNGVCVHISALKK